MGEMEEQSLPRKSTTLDTWYIVCMFGKPVYLFLSALFLLFLRSKLSRRVPARKDCRRNPPDAPNALPIFGHAVAFSSNMARYSLSLKKRYNGMPLRLKLFVMDLYFFTKAEDVAFLFRNSAELTNGPYRKFVSSTFGVPKSFQDYFAADNSGLSNTPPPSSNVPPENRINYLLHKFIVQYMTGANLKPHAARFETNLVRQFQVVSPAPIGEGNDLYTLIRDNLFHASVEAMFGKLIFEVNPNFCQQFWLFEAGVPELAKGLPRWLIKRHYKARDACLASVAKWQTALEQRRRDKCNSFMNEYDDVFGSEIVKRRHDAFSRIEIMGPDARASEDLALIWGSNSNTAHATFWLVYEILRDPQLEHRFLLEIKGSECLNDDNPTGFKRYHREKLCSNPLLQSLYAEALRLYVANIVMRSPARGNLNIGEWSIPPGDVIATMSYPMHQDEGRYNTGSSHEPHPLSDFWGDRFLVPDPTGAVPFGQTKKDGPKPNFSLTDLDGSWFPFGGGSNICPGRYFAKQEMLLTAALLIGNFDIKLQGPPPEVDWRFFGTGVLGVKGNQRFMICGRRGLNTL